MASKYFSTSHETCVHVHNVRRCNCGCSCIEDTKVTGPLSSEEISESSDIPLTSGDNEETNIPYALCINIPVISSMPSVSSQFSTLQLKPKDESDSEDERNVDDTHSCCKEVNLPAIWDPNLGLTTFWPPLNRSYTRCNCDCSCIQDTNITGSLSSDEEVSESSDISLTSGELKFKGESDVEDKRNGDDTHSCCKEMNLPATWDPNLGLTRFWTPLDKSYTPSLKNTWNLPCFLDSLSASSSSTNEDSILVIGGLDPTKSPDFVLGSTIFQYLTSSNTWHYWGKMPDPICYHSTALIGSFLYITGGYSLLQQRHGDMTAISTTFKLNVKNKQWKKCADMNHARATHATVAFQNCLYVFGGRTSSGNILESVEKYSSNEDIWIIISSMPRPAMGLAAVCDLNSIWLVGGITKEVPGNYKKSILTDVYSFIPTSNKWYPEEPLPEGRAFSSCIFKNNYLLVLGGCCISDDVQEIPITSCSSVLCMPLHIVPRKWRSEANLLYPRHAFSTASYGNLIYVIGGILSSKKSACGKVEVFDPESKTSSIGAELPVKIAGTSSILLPSGKLDNGCSSSEFEKLSSENDHNIIQEDGLHEHYSDDSLHIVQNDSNFIRDLKDKKHVSHEIKDEVMPLDESSKRKISAETASFETSDILKPVKVVDRKDFEEKEQTFHYISSYFKEIPASKKDDSKFPHRNVKDTSDVNDKLDASKNVKRYRTSLEVCLKTDLGKTSDKTNIKKSSFLGKEDFAIKWIKHYSDCYRSTPSLSSNKIRSILESDSFSEEKDHKKYASAFLYVQSDLDGKHPTRVASSSLDTSATYEVNQLEYLSKSTSESRSDEEEIHRRREIHQASRHELDKCLQLPLLGARYLKKEETKSNVPPFVKSLSVIDSYLAVPHIVVMGGEDIQDDSYAVAIGRLMLSLDPVKPKWKLCTLMPVSRSYHCAIFLNGCIYVIGGIDLKKSVNNRHITHDVVIYNLSERRWQKKTPMNYPRAFHSVAAVGGIIYVFGGRNENEDIISSVEAYNPQENCWTVCRSSPYPIAGAAVTVINNLVYVFGGMTCQEDEEVISSSTLIFDPQSNSWMNGPDLPKPTVYSGASSHLNLGWIFGGLVESKQHATSVKDIFQLDVRRQKWKKIGKLSVPRHSSVIISISSQTYVIGGFSTEINECVCSCDVVYPLKKKVSSLTPFPHPLIGMSGILIPPPVSQV